MYYVGDGVPQIFEEAAKWYEKAAKQGEPNAQLSLGAMYYEGRGVPQNYIKAHMWLNLATAGGAKNARRDRDKLAARMTPAQIAEAQRLASEWKPKKE